MDQPPEAPEEAAAGERMFVAHCPRCGVAVAVDTTVPALRQHCSVCGRSLWKLRKRKRPRPRAELTSDGLLPQRSRERVWMPMAGVALVAIGAAVFAVWMLYRPDPPPAVPVETFSTGEGAAIRAVVEQFTAARTADEVLPLLRDGEQFAPAVRAWFAEHPGSQPLAGSLRRSVAKQVQEVRIAEAAVHFEKLPAMNLLCVATPAGWRIDWRAFTGTGDLSLADFMAQKPAAPVLLLTVARVSDYYNGTYADPALWQCLHLSDLSGERVLYAYVARGNAAVLEKTGRLEPPRTLQPAELNRVSRSLALRLRVRPDAGTNPLQAEVESVAGEGWFLP